MDDGTPDPAEDRRDEKSGSDRRTQGDRRSTVAPWTGVERRKSNRRMTADRRGLPHGIFYKTNDPLADLYNWLSDQCYGKWSVGLEEQAEGATKRTVKVLFELESDKNNFMDTVVRA